MKLDIIAYNSSCLGDSDMIAPQLPSSVTRPGFWQIEPEFDFHCEPDAATPKYQGCHSLRLQLSRTTAEIWGPGAGLQKPESKFSGF